MVSLKRFLSRLILYIYLRTISLRHSTDKINVFPIFHINHFIFVFSGSHDNGVAPTKKMINAATVIIKLLCSLPIR